jgi:uroporphyrinogen-III synthase
MASSPEAPLVIIARPHVAGGVLAAELAEMGYESVICPVLDYVAVDPGPLPPAKALQGLILSSAEGARRLGEAAPAAYRDLPVWCVGDATVEAALAAGFSRSARPGGDADAPRGGADLAQRIIDAATPGEAGFLHAGGEDIAYDIVGALRRAGIECQRLILYKTEATPSLPPEVVSALRGGKPACVLLFSARGAVRFRALLLAAGLARAVEHLTALCLGPGIAESAGSGWQGCHIAERPNRRSLLGLLTKLHPPRGTEKD